MSPPRDRGDSSGPQVNPFELGRLLGENAAALARIEDRLSALPCDAHSARVAKLSAEVEAATKEAETARRIAAEQAAKQSWWTKVDPRWLIPVVLVGLGVPQVRACMGEQRATAIEAAVKRIEATPPATKVLVTPIPQPIVIKPDAER